MTDEDFCLIHGREHMRGGHGPIPYCARCEREADHNIHTSYDHPPIPIRTMDWSATLDGYDPGEPDENGTYHGGDAIGRGATEKEAIADLKAQLEERE